MRSSNKVNYAIGILMICFDKTPSISSSLFFPSGMNYKPVYMLLCKLCLAILYLLINVHASKYKYSICTCINI